MVARVIFIVSMLVIAACNNRDREGSKVSPDAPRVALVMKSLANEFFKTMEDSARDFQSMNSESFTLIANGIKNEQDVTGQIVLVEQMIAQEVDALVIAPANSQALVRVLKQALDRGIVVVNIDNKLDPATLKAEGVQIPFIGPDNRAGAKLAGQHLAKSLDKGDEVAIIGGIPSAFNAIQREQGFKDAMKEAGITIVSNQAGNWEMSKANQVAAGILNAHPGLDALLCANDNMALGAVAAVREAGKGDAVLVCGYDSISAVRQLIMEGEIVCTIDQHGDKLAIFGIEYALEILETGIAPADRETSVDLVSAETLTR